MTAEEFLLKYFADLSDLDNDRSNTPKLITLPNDKQTAIIKELIW